MFLKHAYIGGKKWDRQEPEVSKGSYVIIIYIKHSNNKIKLIK